MVVRECVPRKTKNGSNNCKIECYDGHIFKSRSDPNLGCKPGMTNDRAHREGANHSFILVGFHGVKSFYTNGKFTVKPEKLTTEEGKYHTRLSKVMLG